MSIVDRWVVLTGNEVVANRWLNPEWKGQGRARGIASDERWRTLRQIADGELISSGALVWYSDVLNLPDLFHITQPVINMSGADSRPYFREIYATIQTWLPHAENFIVPNATHAMLQTNPKAVAERLAGFFSKHPLPAG